MKTKLKKFHLLEQQQAIIDIQKYSLNQAEKKLIRLNKAPNIKKALSIYKE